jgi:hypothetical protein
MRPRTEIPADFLCPISQGIMNRPVTAQDEQVYDEAEIKKHFAICKRNLQPITSPLTRQTLPGTILIFNRPLHQAINTFLQANPEIKAELEQENREAEELAAQRQAQQQLRANTPEVVQPRLSFQATQVLSQQAWHKSEAPLWEAARRMVTIPISQTIEMKNALSEHIPPCLKNSIRLRSLLVQNAAVQTSHLQMAFDQGNLEALQLLVFASIRSNANPLTVNQFKGAFNSASDQGELCKWLLEVGNIDTETLKQIFQAASRYQSVATVKLIEAKIEEIIPLLSLAINEACKTNNYSVYQYLVAFRTNWDITDVVSWMATAVQNSQSKLIPPLFALLPNQEDWVNDPELALNDIMNEHLSSSLNHDYFELSEALLRELTPRSPEDLYAYCTTAIADNRSKAFPAFLSAYKIVAQVEIRTGDLYNKILSFPRTMSYVYIQTMLDNEFLPLNPDSVLTHLLTHANREAGKTVLALVALHADGHEPFVLTQELLKNTTEHYSAEVSMHLILISQLDFTAKSQAYPLLLEKFVSDYGQKELLLNQNDLQQGYRRHRLTPLAAFIICASNIFAIKYEINHCFRTKTEMDFLKGLGIYFQIGAVLLLFLVGTCLAANIRRDDCELQERFLVSQKQAALRNLLSETIKALTDQDVSLTQEGLDTIANKGLPEQAMSILSNAKERSSQLRLSDMPPGTLIPTRITAQRSPTDEALQPLLREHQQNSR